MPRPSLREKILTEGFNVVLEQGYCGATVRDIVRAAGVPQGSFTNHFESKEAFCLELLIRYFAMVQQNITKTLRNDSLKPLHRLRQWFDIQFDFLKQADFRNGCLIGNFSAEVGAHSDTIHAKLAEMHADIHESVVYCLKAAIKSGSTAKNETSSPPPRMTDSTCPLIWPWFRPMAAKRKRAGRGGAADGWRAADPRGHADAMAAVERDDFRNSRRPRRIVVIPPMVWRGRADEQAR